MTYHNGSLLVYLYACSSSPFAVFQLPSSGIEPDTNTVSPDMVGSRTSNVTATLLAFTVQLKGAGAYVPAAEVPAQVEGSVLAAEAPHEAGTIEERRAAAVRKDAYAELC